MTLLDQIEAYLTRTGMPPSTFGTYAANDGKLVTRLRNGGDVTTTTERTIKRWMRENRRPRRKARA